MIYLRTGANGSHKTLFTLKDVRDLQVKESRPVCWNGRFLLKAEIEKAFGWKRIEFKDWQAQDDGTIFLIDECHNDMPLRATGSAVPAHISKMAEHRARGFDFFLLTQHPSNIDVFIRKIIGPPGWHQHLKRVFGGSSLTRVLQWDAPNMNCEKDGSGKTAQISTRGQPKEVFDWYESASLHTAKRRVPAQVYVFVGALALAIAAGFYVVSLMRAKVGPLPGGVGSSSVVAGVTGATQVAKAAVTLTVAQFVDLQRPRIEGLAHTAPVYDELTKPRRAPVPAACVQSKSHGCKCYTQDATPYATTGDICAQIVAGGVFLPFVEPVRYGRVVSEPEPSPAPIKALEQMVDFGPRAVVASLKSPSSTAK